MAGNRAPVAAVGLKRGVTVRIDRIQTVTAYDEDSPPVKKQAKTQHSKYTVNTVVADAIHRYRLLQMGLLRCGLVD